MRDVAALSESGTGQVSPVAGMAGLCSAASVPRFPGDLQLSGKPFGAERRLVQPVEHTLFSSMFFLPALLGVFCAWQWRLEHADHNWNSFLTAPVPVGDLCLAKLIWAAVISLLSQAWIGVLFILSGKLVGLTGPIPPELPEWLLCGTLGGVSVCAVQLYFSLIIRAFAPPVAFGLVGGIAGLMVTAQGFGYAFPYSLLCIGMRANNPTMGLNFAAFLLSAFVYTVVFTLLAVRHLRRHDTAAE